MRIQVITDDAGSPQTIAEHGLSLYVEACGRRFFFDLGQSAQFVQNARIFQVEVQNAEFAVISHGHYDHGGGLKTFLEQNGSAQVYINSNARGNFYSLKEDGMKYIGLDSNVLGNKRIVWTQGCCQISPGLVLFSNVTERVLFSPSNSRLFKQNEYGFSNDDFVHEQNLIVKDGNNRVLITGCAHCGIINIMNRAEQLLGEPLTHVVGGFHLAGVDSTDFLDALAQEMMKRSCSYYCCHCTSITAYNHLKRIMGNMIGYATGNILL